MRQLILEEWITLDGYAADRNGDLGFFPSTEASREADRLQLEAMKSIDSMILGRKTYEMFADYWPAMTTEREIIADALNGLDRYVVSSTLDEAPWGEKEPATVLRGDAADRIRELKETDGKDIIIWGSISLAQTLLEAGLIDRVRLNICPAVLGGGKALFPDADALRSLRLVESRSLDNGVVRAEYEVIGDGD